MLAHHGLDGFAGFIGIVERNCGDVVVENVRFDDPMEERAPYESEFAVDR